MHTSHDRAVTRTPLLPLRISLLALLASLLASCGTVTVTPDDQPTPGFTARGTPPNIAHYGY